MCGVGRGWGAAVALCHPQLAVWPASHLVRSYSSQILLNERGVVTRVILLSTDNPAIPINKHYFIYPG